MSKAKTKQATERGRERKAEKRKKGGLDLPSITSLYKSLQVSRQAQLLTSADPCVRKIAEDSLIHQLNAQRQKFSPAVVVRDVMVEDPSRTRRRLVAAVKSHVKVEDAGKQWTQLCSLPRQGQLAREFTTTSPADVWASALQLLPEEVWKFALNSAQDTLPHNSNLKLWRKKTSSSCPLCHDHQNLVHVLNSCKKALEARRYNQRHDRVLQAIFDFIKERLPDTTLVSADLQGGYHFPTHIAETELRPDIVCWDDSTKKILIIELTIPYDTLMAEAAQRKEAKYSELVSTVRKAGYHPNLITLEVGSRGLPYTPGFQKLKTELGLSHKSMRSFMTELSKEALTGSFKIWCSRNRANQDTGILS